MKIYRIHFSLRILILLSLGLLALFFVEIALLGQYSGHVISRSLALKYCAGWLALFFIPLLFAAKKIPWLFSWNLFLIGLQGVSLVVASFWLKKTSVAYLAIATITTTLFYSLWAMWELQRSFRHSGVRWYEGYPSLLPKVAGILTAADGSSIDCKFAKLEPDGAFSLFSIPIDEWLKHHQGRLSLSLQRGKTRVSLPVRPILFDRRINGLGIEFVAQKADDKEDIALFFLGREGSSSEQKDHHRTA